MSIESSIAALRALGCEVTTTEADGYTAIVQGTPYATAPTLSALLYVTVRVPWSALRTPTASDMDVESGSYVEALMASRGLALALIPGTPVAEAVADLRRTCREGDATYRVEALDGRCIEQRRGRTAEERARMAEDARLSWLRSRNA